MNGRVCEDEELLADDGERAVLAPLGRIVRAASTTCAVVLEFVDAGTVAVFFFVQPLVGAFLGAVVLDEQVEDGMILGDIIISAGIHFVSTARAESSD